MGRAFSVPCLRESLLPFVAWSEVFSLADKGGSIFFYFAFSFEAAATLPLQPAPHVAILILLPPSQNTCALRSGSTYLWESRGGVQAVVNLTADLTMQMSHTPQEKKNKMIS